MDEIRAAVLLNNSHQLIDPAPSTSDSDSDYVENVLNGYVLPPPIIRQSSSSSDTGPESGMGRYNTQTPDTDDNYEFQKEGFDEHYQKMREEQMEKGINETSD